MSFDIAVQSIGISEAAKAKFNQFMENKGLSYTLDMLDDWRANCLWMVGDEDGPALEVTVWACNEKFEKIKDPAKRLLSNHFEISASVSGSASVALFVGAGLAYALNSTVSDMQCIASDPYFKEILKDIPTGTSNVSECSYDPEFAFQLAKVIQAEEDKRTR